MLTALTALTAACSDKPEKKTTVWQGPPRASAGGTVAVARFNRYAAAATDEPARSPVEAVTEFLRLDRVRARATSLLVATEPEGQDNAVVTVSLDGLLDDSVRGERFVVRLRRDKERWRLVSAERVQRCWPGRGHEQFTPEMCL